MPRTRKAPEPPPPQFATRKGTGAALLLGVDAVDTFVAAGEKWRDPLTAAKGFAQEKQYAEAEAALKAALGPVE